MFSQKEKQLIAQAVEKVLLDLNHPEMPKVRPDFTLKVSGEESWSFAEIKPNWHYKNKTPGKNLWNETAREIME